MAKKYQAPRGTHDVIPPDVSRWQFLESQFADLASLYGYQEIRTPAFEDTDLFVRSSGDTSEVVTKQMYTFDDKGGRSMTLKPEGTAPVIRAFLENNLGQQNQVSRLWYATQIFRYERPQKGRYRAAHQVGLELIGSPAPEADAEIIEMTVRFYERLGIKDVKVLMNCIGRKKARAEYGSAILEHVASWFKDQDSEVQARATKNPLRLLDSKDAAIKEAVVDAPSILNFLSDDSKQHFDRVQSLLQDASVAFTVDPEIVRGLDYYTDTVFEVQSAGLGSQNALCGGGRYDDLIKDVGGQDTPAVGVAMGVERALIVMEEQEILTPDKRLDVFVTTSEEENWYRVKSFTKLLRESNYKAQCAFQFDKLSRQHKQAKHTRPRLILFVSQREKTETFLAANGIWQEREDDFDLDRELLKAVKARIDRLKTWEANELRAAHIGYSQNPVALGQTTEETTEQVIDI